MAIFRTDADWIGSGVMRVSLGTRWRDLDPVIVPDNDTLAEIRAMFELKSFSKSSLGVKAKYVATAFYAQVLAWADASDVLAAHGRLARAWIREIGLFQPNLRAADVVYAIEPALADMAPGRLLLVSRRRAATATALLSPEDAR